MLLNCVVGEDSWESLGLQGDPTSPSWSKSVLNIYWKDWCWSWSSNTLATWCEELTHWKRPWCWERSKVGGEGTTDDEMVGWHHWLDRHEFESAPGVGDGQGSLACCSPWGHKESTRLSDWTKLNYHDIFCYTNCLIFRQCSTFRLVSVSFWPVPVNLWVCFTFRHKMFLIHLVLSLPQAWSPWSLGFFYWRMEFRNQIQVLDMWLHMSLLY